MFNLLCRKKPKNFVNEVQYLLLIGIFPGLYLKQMIFVVKERLQTFLLLTNKCCGIQQ